MADVTANPANSIIKGVGALTDQQRQTAAYNMLAAAYGPAVAYNPTNALAAANASANMPLASQSAQAGLASAQAEAPLKQAQTAQAQANTTNLNNMNAQTAGIRGARMLQGIANPDGSIPQDEAAHVLSNPAYGLSPGEQQAYLTQLSQPKQVDAKGNVIHPGGTSVLDNIISGLQQGGKVSGPATVVTNPDGTTSIIRTTSAGGEVNTNIGKSQTAPQERVDTANAALEERKRQDAYLRAHGWTEAMIQNYRAGTQANNTAFGAAPGATLPTVNQNGPANNNTLPKPSTDLIGAGNPPGSKTAPAVPQLTGKPLATRSAQANLIQNADTNTSTASKMLDQAMSQASAYTAGAGSWGDWLRGSQAANLRANLSAIRGQVGSAIISSMKNAQGQMGFRMTQAEFKTLTDSLGALGQEQSADQLKQHLTFARNAINDFNQHMHANFQTQWGTDPYSATGSTPPGGAQPAPQDIVNELRRRGVVK